VERWVGGERANFEDFLVGFFFVDQRLYIFFKKISI